MPIKDWSSTAASNTTIDGINIAENCPFANLNDAARAIMANVRQEIADQGTTVTAATLTTISGASQFKILSGGTTISAFDTAVTGLYREMIAGSTLVLSPTTALGLQHYSGNISLEPGALIKARSLGAGNWAAFPERATGRAVVENSLLSDGGTSGYLLTGNGAGSAPTFQVQVLPTGYLNGFTLSNNSGDATHDIDVAAGAARDSTDALNLTTSATIVKQTDVSFAEYTLPGTASGGMDSTTTLTGSSATVHVFMIGGTGKNTQPFFSTAISPTLPSGFTKKVYVNSLLWDGSTMRPFKQRGRDEISLVTPVDQTATNPGSSAVTITLTVPTGVELQAKVALYTAPATASAVTGLSALDAADLVPITNYGFDVLVSATTTQNDGAVGWVKTNTSGQIRSRASASGASNSQTISSLGWKVMR